VIKEQPLRSAHRNKKKGLGSGGERIEGGSEAREVKRKAYATGGGTLRTLQSEKKKKTWKKEEKFIHDGGGTDRYSKQKMGPRGSEKKRKTGSVPHVDQIGVRERRRYVIQVFEWKRADSREEGRMKVLRRKGPELWKSEKKDDATNSYGGGEHRTV